MKKPIIGIPSKQNEYKDDIFHFEKVVSEHRNKILKHGGLCIVITPTQNTLKFPETDLGDDTVLTEEEIAGLHQQVDLCDGIILQGGDYSYAYEVEIARYAMEKDIPLLGTCAGFNNILRALGSNIYEDKSGRHASKDKNYRHPIIIEKSTKLYEIIGSERYEVNTFHTMIADDDNVKGYATISSHSEDGLVESFEVNDKKFVLAVKWHPELMEDEGSDKIFAAFIKAVNC